MENKVEQILKEIGEIKVDIAEIKVDVRHHIKRSDQHEEALIELSRVKYMIYGALAFLSILASIFGIYGVFK